jgi:asparagine synthase (glutamine-hydrolysing)
VSAIAGAIDWSRGSASADHLDVMLASFPLREPDLVAHKSPHAAVGRIQLGRGADGAFVPELLVAIDGEVENAPDLASQLGLRVDAPVARVVAAAFERWGVEACDRLRGEAVVVVWDGRARTLFAMRDRLAVRPLFYCTRGSAVLVSSHPEPLLATGVATSAPDDEVVADYLLWNFNTAERSFFRDIRRVPGGHVLVARSGRTEIREYRRLELVDRGLRTKADFQEELRRLFFRAVERRLQSPRPVVMQLSGGVDSSAIVCVADRLLAESGTRAGAVAAGAVHPGMACDESGYIRAVEERVRLPVETWDGTQALETELEDVPVYAPGGRFPLANGTEGDVEIARRLGAEVILSGMGGDQVGSSYGVLRDSVTDGRLFDTYAFIKRAPWHTAADKRRLVLRLAKSLAPAWLRRAHDALRPRREERPAWLAEHAWRRERLLYDPVLSSVPRTEIQRQRWLDVTSPRHVFGIEVFQEHAMRNGLELRLPFMDWELTQLILATPPRHWPPPWPNERLHRDALAALLPEAVAQRRTKANFSLALANRVKRQARPIRAMLSQRQWRAEAFVDRREILRLLGRLEHEERPDFSLAWAVWSAATLEAWLARVSRYTS